MEINFNCKAGLISDYEPSLALYSLFMLTCLCVLLLEYSNPVIVKHMLQCYTLYTEALQLFKCDFYSILSKYTLYFHNDEEKKLHSHLINLECAVLLWQFLRINLMLKQIFSPQSCPETSLSSLSCSSSYELGLSSPAEPKDAQWQEIPNWISVNLANYEFFGDHFSLIAPLTNVLSMKVII